MKVVAFSLYVSIPQTVECIASLFGSECKQKNVKGIVMPTHTGVSITYARVCYNKSMQLS